MNTVANIGEKEMRAIAQNVWSATLGLELQAVSENVRSVDDPTLIASVQITGAWQGGVSVHCSCAQARRFAALMFGAEASASDTRDAMGELTNMVGGNLKGCLTGPAQLSLPTVFEGSEVQFAIHGAQRLRQVCMQCEEGSIFVVLWEQNGAEGRTP